MKKFSSGQSLWEVVIALAVAGLIVVGLVKVTSSSVKSSRFSKDQSQMTAIGQARINQIIDYINKNYNTFWSNPIRPTLIPHYDYKASEDYCLLTEVIDKSADFPTTTPDYAEAKMVTIFVDVFWGLESEGTQCDNKKFSHKLHFETYATN